MKVFTLELVANWGERQESFFLPAKAKIIWNFSQETYAGKPIHIVWKLL